MTVKLTKAHFSVYSLQFLRFTFSPFFTLFSYNYNYSYRNKLLFFLLAVFVINIYLSTFPPGHAHTHITQKYQ